MTAMEADDSTRYTAEEQQSTRDNVTETEATGVEETRKRKHDAISRSARRESAAEAFLMSPLKTRRSLSTLGRVLESSIRVVVDNEETLSARLEQASKMWVTVRDMSWMELVDFVERRISYIVELVEALVDTGYFPLQQLCFMVTAAVLCQLQQRDERLLSAFVVICREKVGEAEWWMMDLLPLKEEIAWSDPLVAREHVIAMNRRTELCTSHRVLRCWVSPQKNEQLTRLRIDKWLDFGATTATFYWNDDGNVVVVNVPYACVDGTEIDHANNVVYMRTKQLDRLGGVRLLAFSATAPEFSSLAKAIADRKLPGSLEENWEQTPSKSTQNLLALTPEALFYTGAESLNRTSSPHVEVARPDVLSSTRESSTSNTSSPRASLSGHESNESRPSSPRTSQILTTPIQASSAMEYSPSRSQTHATSFLSIGSVSSTHMSPRLSSPSAYGVSSPSARAWSALNDFDDDIDGSSFTTSSRILDTSLESFDGIQDRFEKSRSALIDSFSELSAGQLERSNEFAKREYQLRATAEELQRQRMLQIPQVQYDVENDFEETQSSRDEYYDDAINYASETLSDDDNGPFFITAAILLLMIVVLPWLLFMALTVVSGDTNGLSYPEFVASSVARFLRVCGNVFG